LTDLDKKLVELSTAVLSASEDSKKFTGQIESIDSQLSIMDSEYEAADELFNQLQL
jgi:hypothetical protein